MKAYIVRDNNGSLFLCKEEPYKANAIFWHFNQEPLRIPEDLFPEVTWESGIKVVEIK